MENYRIAIRLIYVAIIVQAFSCLSPSPDMDFNVFSEREQELSRDWQYELLEIDGDTFNLPGANFDPINPIYTVFSVNYRWFSYSTKGNYELRWDSDTEAVYETVSMGDSNNYQPNFGYWKLNTTGDSLIHNSGYSYETHYKIVHLSKDRFVREYLRTVLNIDEETTAKYGWVDGDVLVYRETFVPREK